MSTISQVGRGAVLLTSMALVACYIDVYATGKFPWQHTAAETPATVSPPEWINDPAMQPAQFVVEQSATKPSPIFLPGSKSDVMGNTAVVGLDPTASTPTSASPPATVPVFMSGSKSYGGATGLLPGALKVPATPQADQKAPSFMGGSKTIMLPTRLPETASPPNSPGVSPEKMQFMSGFKSPGPSVIQGTSLQTLPQSAPPGTPPATYPQQPSTNNQSFRPNVSPQQKTPWANGASATNANAPAPVPQFMSGSKSPFSKIPQPQQTAPPPMQQQAAPIKLPPLSPAGSY